VDQGAWLQVTAGSLTGRFGSRPRYWGERLLGEGRVQVLATDSHGVKRRPPLLAEGRAAAERLVGLEESWHLVRTRPAGILDNLAPSALPALPRHSISEPVLRSTGKKAGFLGRLFGGGKRR
jgi:protein-tyrosine phosphatase